MEGSLPLHLIELKVNSSQPCYTWPVLPIVDVTVMPNPLLSMCPSVYLYISILLYRVQSVFSSVVLQSTFQSMQHLQESFTPIYSKHDQSRSLSPLFLQHTVGDPKKVYFQIEATFTQLGFPTEGL